MLTAPDPVLAYDPLAPGVAARERPLTVAVGPVVRQGIALGPQELTAADLHVYRRAGAAEEVEVWDRAGEVWVPDSGVVTTAGDPLIYRAELAQPWQAIVLGAGGKPLLHTAVAGYPQYSFRVRFDTAYEEVVTESPVVTFGSVTDRNLMVLGPADGEQLDNATQARIQLRDPALATVGGLVVERDAGSARVRLSNSAGASIVLMPDGSIEMTPAAGRPVLINGDLETGRLVYADASGTRKQAN